MQEDTYITAQQLAQMLNLKGRGTVYQMRRKGILPEGVRIGGVRRWSMAELHRFLTGGGVNNA